MSRELFNSALCTPTRSCSATWTIPILNWIQSSLHLLVSLKASCSESLCQVQVHASAQLPLNLGQKGTACEWFEFVSFHWRRRRGLAATDVPFVVPLWFTGLGCGEGSFYLSQWLDYYLWSHRRRGRCSLSTHLGSTAAFPSPFPCTHTSFRVLVYGMRFYLPWVPPFWWPLEERRRTRRLQTTTMILTYVVQGASWLVRRTFHPNTQTKTRGSKREPERRRGKGSDHAGETSSTSKTSACPWFTSLRFEPPKVEWHLIY